jgi:hypothetical protein
MRIADFLNDPNFLGRDFAGSSWDTWKLVLAAALGEQLSSEQRQQFCDIAGREPPPHRVKELWLAIGRRGGKDSAISALATFLAVFGNYAPHMRRGERAQIVCLAVDKAQAAIVFNYIRAYFEEIRLLRSRLVKAEDGTVELNSGIDIVVATSNFRSIRGRTIACCIFDECAFWFDERYANPDREVYRAVIPALITLRAAGSMLVAISTVYRRAGLFYEKVSAHLGKPDDDVLAILAPSVTFNPLLAEPHAAAEIARISTDDPDFAAAEYDSIWRRDIAAFIDREVAEAMIDRGIYERPYDPRIQYAAFVDVASGSGGDAFAFSVAHREASGVVVQDLLRVWSPPFSPEDCFAEAAATTRAYGCARLLGDKYAAGISVERFAVQGISFDQVARPKSQIYIDFLHLANSRMARLLDHPRQLAELLTLERRTRWGGGETIDHPQHGGHDDAINAAAGAAVLASQVLVPTLWRSQDLKSDGGAHTWPIRATGVFAAVTADEYDVFCTYWAVGADRYPLAPGAPFGLRLLLLDYARSPMSPRLFDGIAGRLEELARCGEHPVGVRGCIAPPELIPQAMAAGLVVLADATRLLEATARASLLLIAASQISAGNLKLTDIAEERATALPLPLADVLRPDAPPSAAGDAVLLGIGGALPPEEKPREWRGKVLF